MTELIEAVRRHADFDSEAEARTATRAVLAALGRRIARGEAEDVADHLAGDPADWILPVEADGPTSLSVDEFVAFVAEEADADQDDAWEYVEAVLGGLSDVLPEAEFRGITSQFPPEYDRLLVET
jgi:uncharacterized protein (DUF2267 family)